MNSTRKMKPGVIDESLLSYKEFIEESEIIDVRRLTGDLAGHTRLNMEYLRSLMVNEKDSEKQVELNKIYNRVVESVKSLRSSAEALVATTDNIKKVDNQIKLFVNAYKK